MSQFLSVADVRNGRTGSRPVSEHAYSIYGYFLYGRPYSLPPWEPIGTLFYTSRRKRKFRKRKYENYPTNRSILPTFFCEIFILFLSLSLSRTLDTSENIFIRFSRFRPERGNFFSFLFFFYLRLYVTRTFRRRGSFVKKKLSDDTSELNTFPFSHESPRV